MAVAFTGDVAADFPEGVAGVVVLSDDPSVIHPAIPGHFAPIIPVSGFDIAGLRMMYTPQDDFLSIGILQPVNPRSGRPVIAGDADADGDGGAASPTVLGQSPSFQDYPLLGGTEGLAAFLDLDADGRPDIVAGISRTYAASKSFRVAMATTDPDPIVAAIVPPEFGSPLDDHAGAAFLKNDPAAPGFEFQIRGFSALYLSLTGKAIRPDSVMRVGATGASGTDGGITESFFPARAVTFPNASTAPPTPGPNSGPTAGDDAYGTWASAPLTVPAAAGVLANDAGTAIKVTGAGNLSELGALVILHPDGTLYYDPTKSAAIRALAPGGSLVDAFRYTIRDADGSPAMGTVRITVEAASAITSARWVQGRRDPDRLVLTAAGALDSAWANDPSAYLVETIASRGRRKLAFAPTSAEYDPASGTVTLTLSRRLQARTTYRLAVSGWALRSPADQALGFTTARASRPR